MAEPERKFVYAPDIEKLGEKVEAATKAADDAKELYEEILDKQDAPERLVYLATAVRDFKRGLLDATQLQERCTTALENLDLPSEIQTLIGPLRDVT